MPAEKLTPSEATALLTLEQHHGSMLVTAVPDKLEKGLYDEVIPGIRTYENLNRRCLVIITEEEPCDFMDGFTFTPSIELTDEGRAALKELK